MAHELDDIRASTECPACNGPLTVTYKTLRLGRTIECPTCRNTIRLIDEHDVSPGAAAGEEPDQS
jgi:uncharacterized protein YbaR (Trm112 family)